MADGPVGGNRSPRSAEKAATSLLSNRLRSERDGGPARSARSPTASLSNPALDRRDALVSLVRAAIALGIVCGLGAQYGWLNALAATVILALTVFLLRVAREAPRILNLNGGHRSELRASRAANYIVCAVAALSRKESARDLALEAMSTLDDMVEDGYEFRRLVFAAVWLALQLPRSISARATSKASPPAVAGDRRPGSLPSEDPQADLPDRGFDAVSLLRDGWAEFITPSGRAYRWNPRSIRPKEIIELIEADEGVRLGPRERSMVEREWAMRFLEGS